MLITLTTDFGYTDPVVGIMKGVIYRINPHAQVVDLSHGIPAQNIMAAALVLRQATPYFPRGPFHVVLVVHGVGSTRLPLLMEHVASYFIGPENGVLMLVMEERTPGRVIHLSNPAYQLQPTSATFHGRDIFAPAAAYLSRGVAPETFGETIKDFARLTWPAVIKTGTTIKGEIVYIDGFGNLSTSMSADDLKELPGHKLRVTLRDLSIPGLTANYAAVEQDKYLALINSWVLL